MAGLDPATQPARVNAPMSSPAAGIFAAQTRRYWVAASRAAMTIAELRRDTPGIFSIFPA
jgi:hypothetical protein